MSTTAGSGPRGRYLWPFQVTTSEYACRYVVYAQTALHHVLRQIDVVRVVHFGGDQPRPQQHYQHDAAHGHEVRHLPPVFALRLRIVSVEVSPSRRHAPAHLTGSSMGLLALPESRSIDIFGSARSTGLPVRGGSSATFA